MDGSSLSSREATCRPGVSAADATVVRKSWRSSCVKQDVNRAAGEAVCESVDKAACGAVGAAILHGILFSS